MESLILLSSEWVLSLRRGVFTTKPAMTTEAPNHHGRPFILSSVGQRRRARCSTKPPKPSWTLLGSVPTTPDPNTSAKVSQYKWEPYGDTNWWCMVYILLADKTRAYLCRSIATEIGGVSRYFSRVSGSGVDLTLLSYPTACVQHPDKRHPSPVPAWSKLLNSNFQLAGGGEPHLRRL